MNKILFAITTNLQEIPAELQWEGFHLRQEPIDESWQKELISLALEQGLIDKLQAKAIRAQKQVIWGESQSNEKGVKALALKTAGLMKKLSEQGCLAFYIENSMKVITADFFQDLDVRDSISLFHLFVELVRTEQQTLTEGMEIFGLPDVIINQITDSAQATIFAASVKMLCEDLKLIPGQSFKATESSAEYLVKSLAFLTEEEVDGMANPNGYLILERG
jgi:hypothetical protein